MHTLDFCTLDVFTTKRYEGNPLALIKLLPAQSEQLTQADKQKIAKEFNLSESIFVHLPHPVDSGDGPQDCTPGLQTGDYKVDIFLTNMEIPFAGHPTIGAATWLAKNGYNPKRIITKAGPIPIEMDNDMANAGIPQAFHRHRWLESLQASTLLSENARPYALCSIVKGMTFLLVELNTSDALDRVPLIQADIHEMLPKVSDLDEGWRTGMIGVYYFFKTQHREDDEQGAHQCISVRTRMLEGLTLEDPATGSAACTLACALFMLEDKRAPKMTMEVTQGVEMGRRSEINVQVEADALGSLADVMVTLRGTAVPVMNGQLII
ncbi:hypothetical protein BCR37DRAFT_380446 [Protomyces lactucae-debilis]|uniref:Diaminopimelate epimerase-like protein n=1 Tax=Protomyces lactucae-debilis TaxID=2754530 RepID=A0A1Y2FCA3_PROLT|nr:uncharacterized protein BCR37DRAFT_380446 [Protomyces lactucae-debilis]ORY81549.1 hypothetical protein BCR37DRAFT_380446 [Protomyces lactucae-debilis]